MSGRAAAVHTATVVLSGVVTVGWWLADPPHLGAPAAFWTIAALAVLVAAWPPPGTGDTTALAPAAFTFALLIGWGVAPAIAVQAVAVVVASVRRRHPSWRVLYVIGRYALAFAAAGGLLAVTGVPLLAGGPTDVGGPGPVDVFLLATAAGVWLIVNDLVLATAVRLQLGDDWMSTVVRLLRREGPARLAMLALAPVVVATGRTGATLLPLLLIPLFAVSELARRVGGEHRASPRDGLTGLPNRDALLRELRVHIRRGRARMGLVLLDLNQFRRINDGYGHTVGDRLLAAVARRLRDRVGGQGLVARLGGDEFAVLAAQPSALAEAVANALAEPVTVDALSFDVTAAVGVATYPDHGADPSTLLRHAESAMYDAKERGAAYAIYGPELEQGSADLMELLTDLRRALEPAGSDQIQILYQPQVALKSGEVVGVEALLRWHHPRYGTVSPDRVTKVAEHSAVMRALTLRVFDLVTSDLSAWKEHGLEIRASVNVSVRDLHRPEFVDRLAELLAARNLPANQIQLEITETALLTDARRVMVTLHRLDALGISLSLDDFGTGYSSLQHLRRLPLTEVKIDRAFVLGMTTDPDDAAVVTSIVDLGRALGLRVVAEGVEDDRTRRLLVASACEVAQGWYYARPMTADGLVAWLARYRPAPRANERIDT
jgi:diguanylate cyclase (GGDEF)-like protein